MKIASTHRSLRCVWETQEIPDVNGSQQYRAYTLSDIEQSDYKFHVGTKGRVNPQATAKALRIQQEADGTLTRFN